MSFYFHRILSLHHTQSAGFSLLSTLLQIKNFHPDTDMWNLFIPNVSHFSQDALCFLAAYLQSHDLPEEYQPRLALGMTPEKYALREQLLQWLLMSKEEGDDAAPQQLGADTALLAEVLVCLTLRDTRVLTVQQSTQQTKYWDKFKELEATYLRTTFNIAVNDGLTSSGRNCEMEAQHSSQLSGLEAKMTQMVVRDAQALLDITEPQVQSPHTHARTHTHLATCKADYLSPKCQDL